MKKQLEVEKELVTSAKDGYTETAKDEGIDVNAKDLKERTSLQLEREKSVARSEKKGKELDRIIREEKDKVASNLMKSMKSGELMSFKDDVVKEIFIEYCNLEVSGKVITSILEPKIEEKHRAFNNKRGSGCSSEESNSELASIIAGKKYLKRYKEARFKAKNLVEGTFVDFSRILGEKQMNRDKKYRFQKLEKKLRSAVQDIEEVIIAQFRECTDDYSEEELGLRLDGVSQELENNVVKLKDWISQEVQKNKQECEQKDDRMMGKKMQNMLKKSNVDLLSLFAPKKIVDSIVQVVEGLPERNLMKIRVGKMVCEHENLKKKCQSFLSEKFSLSEFKKLEDEVMGVTDRFFKLCNTFYLLSTEDKIVKQLKDLLEGNDLDSLKILEEGSESHSEETSQSNSNLSGVSVFGHSIQVRGECSKQK